ncbi:MAG: DUF4058 family protein [Gemmataceae bacterium]
MPLRNHFRPPVSKRASWEMLHGQWPAAIVQQLRTTLPPGFTAGPRVHLGTFYEIDVSAYEADDVPQPAPGDAGGGAVAAWTATEPSVAVEVEPEEEYEYAVHVYDAERDQTLVAAVELVSPANKDRPEKRNSFVARCAALLKGRGVGVRGGPGDGAALQPVHRADGVHRPGGGRPDERRPAGDLRRRLPVGAARGQDAARNVVPRHARR